MNQNPSKFFRGNILIQTNLTEIFSGDVPRIDNVVIVPGQNAGSLRVGLLVESGAQLTDHYLVACNVLRRTFDTMKAEHYPESVLVVRTKEGFRIECGDLPERFQGTFSLDYCPSFTEANLPKGNERVLKLLNEIRERQARLDEGMVGSGAYYMSGNLWGRTRGLGKLMKELKGS